MENDFIKSVIDEATLIRKHATQKEKSNLNFASFDPKDHEGCVYGQMTGSCYNNRAINLIKKCVNKMRRVRGLLHESFLSEVIPCEVRLDGTRTAYDSNNDFIDHQLFTPIETFIADPANQYNGNNEKLLAFIRGDSKTLDLSFVTENKITD